MLTLNPFHLQFTIPIKAKPKQSTRIAGGHGSRKGWAYPDPGNKQYEATVRNEAALAMKKAGYKLPVSLPVKVFIFFFFPIAKNRKKTLKFMDPHVQIPDIDNLEKGINDSIKQVVVADDSLICGSEKYKVWAPSPMIEVAVTPVDMDYVAKIRKALGFNWNGQG